MPLGPDPLALLPVRTLVPLVRALVPPCGGCRCRWVGCWACSTPNCPPRLQYHLPPVLARQIGRQTWWVLTVLFWGGEALDAPGRWPSQAAVAAERVALPYATRFQLESAALIGLGAVGSGDSQARATPSPNAQSWRRSAAFAVADSGWSSQRYATPMGVIQKHVCPSHWDGDQALTCLDRSPVPSQDAVAAERVALLYATRFQLESAALNVLGAVGPGDPQARATPSPNARKWHRSAVSAVADTSWSSRRYTTPMGG